MARPKKVARTAVCYAEELGAAKARLDYAFWRIWSATGDDGFQVDQAHELRRAGRAVFKAASMLCCSLEYDEE